ncbi:MAG: hypothetical protein OEY89_03080 [Gammaproteobacteria bacterium]|nr:hypothetical protein [Gammaproteobacteria bacterium]
MWHSFPNDKNAKLWIDSKSSLKSAFALYNPYSKLPRLIKNIVNIIPDFIGNLPLKYLSPAKNIKQFESYKYNIDKILGIDAIINITPGTKSKHQKTTVQIINNSITGYFLKISENTETIKLSKNEYLILNFLKNKKLSFSIPMAIFGDYIDSSYYLIQSAPLTRFKQSKQCFNEAHEKALIDLYNLGTTISSLKDYILDIQGIINNTTFNDSKNLIQIINEIDISNKMSEIQLSLSHGDFAPWNILANKNDELFIFDWEHGNKTTPLLFDFFHFHYMIYKLLKQLGPEEIINHLDRLYYEKKYQKLFNHMKISKDQYNLYMKLYMISIIIREINENNQPSEISLEVFKKL